MKDFMPPITLNDMLEILGNPNFKTYLVLGEESEDAWKLGLAAQNFLPGVRSYLVKQPSQDEVRNYFSVPMEHVGITFGRSLSIHKTLTKDVANDFLSVCLAIHEAQ